MAESKQRGKVIPFPSKSRSETGPPSRAGADESSEVARQEPLKPSFAMFGEVMMSGRTEEAGVMLMAMLELDSATALFAAEYFYQQYQKDPTIVAKAMAIRGHITQNQANDALISIFDCFGLQGLQGIQMLSGFSKWLNK